MKHALTIQQYQVEDEDPTDSLKELPEDQIYYTYLMEIDDIMPQNQNVGPQIDLKNLHTKPAIIPLEATTPQADQRSYTDIGI